MQLHKSPHATTDRTGTLATATHNKLYIYILCQPQPNHCVTHVKLLFDVNSAVKKQLQGCKQVGTVEKSVTCEKKKECELSKLERKCVEEGGESTEGRAGGGAGGSRG